MSYCSSIRILALSVALAATTVGARAADDAKYPNWKGQWDTVTPRFGGQMIKFDPTKLFVNGPTQQAISTTSQILGALSAGPVWQTQIAVQRRDAKSPATKLESSGGLSLESAADYAGTGVDYLAVGALTHSVRVLDIGLDI